MWNKQQFILHVMYQEMTKPEDERLDWLLWADGDTMVLDQCRHPSDFLPPKKNDVGGTGKKAAAEIQLIAAKDWNGFNAGVFFIRVSEWSINLLNAVNAFRLYNPGEKLVFAEQSAMTQLFELDQFKHNITFVPQHWFNAYPHPDRSYTADVNSTNLESHQARRGDFMVHFPGYTNRHEAMLQWLTWLGIEGNVWESGRIERNVLPEIKEFWDKELTG
jgi:lipopolysaccharide biosynthesis glycosyltransferase